MTSASNANSDNSSSKTWLVGLVAITFVVRAGVVVLMPDGLSRDTDSYRKIAESVRLTGTFGFPSQDLKFSNQVVSSHPRTAEVRPTAYRPPLYPLILAGLVFGGKLFPSAVGALHVLCGVLTVYLVWNIARQWELGRSAAIAALLTACDPILLHQSTQLMTETLATLTAVMALWGLSCWWRRPSAVGAVTAGLLLGLACLCRPTFLPWSALVVVSCWRVERTRMSPGRAAVCLVAGTAVVLLPWGLRNYLQFGQLKFTTTHGGYTLLLGNNPSYYRFLREAPFSWGSVWDSQELDAAWLRRGEIRDASDDLLGLSRHDPQADGRSVDGRSVDERSVDRPLRTEFEDDRLAYEFARRYIRENPGMFAYSCLIRIGSLWQLLPHRVQSSETTGRWMLRCGTAVWYLIVFALAIRGTWRLGTRNLSSPWLWGLLLCFAFTAVHSLYWSNMRMRAPLVPFVSLLAAAGLVSSRWRDAASEEL